MVKNCILRNNASQIVCLTLYFVCEKTEPLASLEMEPLPKCSLCPHRVPLTQGRPFGIAQCEQGLGAVEVLTFGGMRIAVHFENRIL